MTFTFGLHPYDNQNPTTSIILDTTAMYLITIINLSHHQLSSMLTQYCQIHEL